MATSETLSGMDKLARTWDFVLAGRPLLALAAALLTTTGHTLNLRELGIAKGWVNAEVNFLQTTYLVSLSLTLIACPSLGQRFSCRGLAESGLALLLAGSFLNGFAVYESLAVFTLGRVLAGCGAGLAIFFSQRLLDERWSIPALWALILLPPVGPGAVAAATMINEVSDWASGFILEGAAAGVGLVLLLSMAEAHEARPAAPRGSLAFLSPLVVAIAALLYCLHWGQLHGWLESFDIVVAFLVTVAASTMTLWLVWPQLDFRALGENWLRLLLLFFGGTCQFLLGSYLMNAYGGSIINFISWQRAWLIWPLPIGAAAALSLWQLGLRRVHLLQGFSGAFMGLLLLAGGLFLALERTMNWPYWQPLATIDLNWFPAPQHWQLAPGRFLMGLGIGLFMIAMNYMVSADPAREEKVQPFLSVLQFFGGGIASALLVNFLMIGHAIQYSYSADRDYIQAAEMTQRRADLRDALAEEGVATPDRAAEVLLYRGVNYEADNLVFASIYAAFLVTALVLAGMCMVLIAIRKIRALPSQM
ncbi:MAG: hypothetical protein ACYC3I_10400 [Gemmataceae bacterium]